MSIRGGEARNMIDEHGERVGWNAESKIDLLCDYINNQQDGACLDDFLRENAREEESNLSWYVKLRRKLNNP